jgi:hypothetical protein
MKWFLMMSFLFAQALGAQALRQDTTSYADNLLNNFISPRSMFVFPKTNLAGPTSLDQLALPLGAPRETLDRANTAPTPIPDDTSLIFRPSNDFLRQAQEEEPVNSNTLREDTETSPGNITGGAKDGADINNFP